MAYTVAWYYVDHDSDTAYWFRSYSHSCSICGVRPHQKSPSEYDQYVIYRKGPHYCWLYSERGVIQFNRQFNNYIGLIEDIAESEIASNALKYAKEHSRQGRDINRIYSEHYRTLKERLEARLLQDSYAIDR